LNDNIYFSDTVHTQIENPIILSENYFWNVTTRTQHVPDTQHTQYVHDLNLGIPNG